MITASDISTRTVQLTAQDLRIVKLIAQHTKNTWQRDRDLGEIELDTAFGKLAERALMEFMAENGIRYVDWDDIRKDNYRRHTALDGFMARAQATVDLSGNSFADRVYAGLDGAYLATTLRDKLEREGVASYEVKSTRIAGRLMNSEGRADRQAILGDDFLAYPVQREGQLTAQLQQQFLAGASRTVAEQRSPLVLVRVYMKPPKDLTDRVAAGLIGWIDRHSFYTNCTVKTMSQPGKSERAIYYAVPIRTGRPMSQLSDFLERM